MKHNRNVLWPVAVLPILCAFGSRGTDVGFHPAEGLTVSKHYQNDSQLTLDDSSMTMNGNDMPMEMEMSSTSKYELGVTDTYAGVADGSVTKLKRTFDQISSSTESHRSVKAMGQDHPFDTTMNGTSPLEGKSVVFTRNDDGDYDASWAPSNDGDASLLEDLDAELDFAALLPDGEVEKGGDSWTIDPEAFRRIFVPGGALKIDMKAEGGDEQAGMNGPEPSPDQIFGEFEGDASGQLADVVEEDGAHVAVIHLVVDVSSAKDLTDLMKEMMEKAKEDMPVEMTVGSFDAEFSFKGEGELRWNLDKGVFQSLHLSGSVEQTMDTSMKVNAQGQSMDVENSMSLSGTSKIEATSTIEG